MRFRRTTTDSDGVDEIAPVVAGVDLVAGCGGGLRLPRHRGTTAHVASIYPFHGGRALHNVAAPFVGVNIADGQSAWCFDPFELYGRDLGGGTVLTNSNMLVLGEPGNGKSSAVKTMLYRQAAFYGRRRFISISDPKGEYGPLARALDMPVIKLHPGGTDRLNLLEAGPGDPVRSVQNRQELMTGMLATVLRRDLDPVEETLLNTAIEVLDAIHRERLDDPTIVDLATLLSELPDSVRGIEELALLDDREIAAAVTNVRLALSKLLRTTLRGMFDGASTVSVEAMSGQGVVVDLSSVFSNPEALPLVQMAAASTLAGQMANLPAQGRRGMLVDDEVWATMASERAAKTLQSRLKLCRLWGIWNILITHRLSDLNAQADSGTSASKVAEGLLADVQTRVVFRQATDQLTATGELLRMNDRLVELLPRLTRGRSVWTVAGRAAVVQHVIAANGPERAICDTDEAMAA
jgi:type IV secretory pathway VirB4 component